MKEFKNKVVVVTGGATGIGRELAARFGTHGAKVIICGLREDRLEEATKQLENKGIEARYKVCDVTKLDEVKALADYAWDEFGQVDVLVNNAGVLGDVKSIIDLTESEVDRVFKVNVIGVLNGIWAFAKRMIAQETPATILTVSSEAGLYYIRPESGPYHASKSAVKCMMESFNDEVPSHIHVGIIYPGIVQSEIGGGKEITTLGMPTRDFVDTIWPQIENGELHIVSHSTGAKYFSQFSETVKKSYDTYAPRYEGDEVYDLKHLETSIAEGMEIKKRRNKG